MTQPGRNDPCPCGSGKKYKKCCLREESATVGRESAFGRALRSTFGWFDKRDSELVPMLAVVHVLRLLGEDDAGRFFDKLEQLPEHHRHAFEANSLDWIIAESTVDDSLRDEEEKRWSSQLLGVRGAILGSEERGWLEALAQSPLRVYEVAEVEHGEGLRLRDVLSNEHEWVTERSGSKQLAVGDVMAVRIVRGPEPRPRLNGLMPIARDRYLKLRPELVRISKAGAKRTRARRISDHLWRCYLRSYIRELPVFVDRGSGEPILLVTHHYRVRDWTALERALDAEPLCRGSREHAWTLREEHVSKEGRVSIEAGINPSDRGDDRLELFARTRAKAERAREWLDRVAGESIRFLTTEIVDPTSVVDRAGRSGGNKPSKPTRDPRPEIEPAEMTAILQTYVQDQYSDFMDAPLPYLGNRSPRQALETAAGRVEVEELVRSYEIGERQQAQSEGREPVSFEFLWRQVRK